MPALPSRREKRNLLRVLLGGAVVAAIVLASAPVLAGDDDDGIDSRIIRGILKGVGLRDDSPNIEYRERSPLVIPQGRNLPAPETSGLKDPNWPVEADVKREREAKAAAATTYGRETGDPFLDESRPLTPDEMMRGRTRTRTSGTASKDWDGKPLKPNELGYKSGVFDSLFNGGGKEESAQFTGEPPRASLVEPPSGYRTPAPNQPYGLGKDRAGSAKPKNYYEEHGTVQ